METTREDLVKRLTDIREESKNIHKELETIDYEDRLDQAKKYLGKCFIEKDEYFKDRYIQAYYCHSIDPESCRVSCVVVGYWTDHESDYELRHNDALNPEKWEETEKYVEITREEFDKHFQVVMGKIQKVINI